MLPLLWLRKICAVCRPLAAAPHVSQTWLFPICVCHRAGLSRRISQMLVCPEFESESDQNAVLHCRDAELAGLALASPSACPMTGAAAAERAANAVSSPETGGAGGGAEGGFTSPLSRSRHGYPEDETLAARAARKRGIRASPEAAPFWGEQW
jgi:hypothetical protein